MSRIGRKPIPVPTSVSVTIEPEVVRVAGPRGDLQERKNRAIEVRQEGEELLVTRPTDRAEHRALHGLTRSLIRLITPPFPAASRPSKITTTRWPVEIMYCCWMTSSRWSFLSSFSNSSLGILDLVAVVSLLMRSI